MKIAIAILNWNGKDLLAEFLPKIIEYSTGAAIYVIDNASTDDSVSFIQKNFPQVQVIQNAENSGFAGGYNEGLKHIDADVYCLLNSDIEVTPHWLDPMYRLFENENIAAIQPKILDYNERNKFEYAGAGGGFLDNFGYPYCRGRVFWTLEKDTGQYDDEIQIFWATGACLFIRSDEFWKQEGFDANFFAHMEEIDLCWRINNTGKKIYYTGQSTVYHIGGATLSNSPQKTYLNFRNSLWMLVRNLPQYKLVPVVFSRMVLDGITAVVFWIYNENGFGHFKAIFRAHISFYQQLGKYYKSRRKVSTKFWKHKFVPWQYFIVGRKTVDKLA
ncbi:glycosyltransferase [Flavobacteriaceae bacterium Ap0902]|nr:glycosyltransferase [Flavobacteriaceae bacterium Ap0902]